MSQFEAYIILQELGGRAKSIDMKKRAREKYPDLMLYTYIDNRMTKLRKSGVVGWDAKTCQWFIKDHDYLKYRNIVVLDAKGKPK